MRVRQGIQRLIATLLVAIFAMYYCESTLFVHTHQYLGGTVTHSHPFLPGGHHSHSATEFQTIHTLAQTTLDEPTVAYHQLVTLSLIAILTYAVIVKMPANRPLSISLRAPPYIAA